MPIHNHDIAEIFDEVADLLEIEDANPFRIRAYRTAARVVDSLSQSLSDMVARSENLCTLPGIGKDLAAKIKEIAESGSLQALRELEARTPPELTKMMRIAGLGGKRVHLLHEKLGVKTIQELREAGLGGKIREIKGFGEKIEKQILEGTGGTTEEKKRFEFAAVEYVAQALLDYLKEVEGVKEAIVAGSFRRRKETVGDLDILVTCDHSDTVMKAFTHYEDVKKVLAQGETKSSVMLRAGLQVDLRVVPQESYGAALHYFTGSKAHNIAIRHLGVKKGLKINEYGVFKGDVRVGGATETEVFKMVNLPYIEPELRENRGEVEAAQKRGLPNLITLSDIKGDLHAHTKTTDGRHTMAQMAEAAKARGYEYLAITNHSKRVSMAHGLDAEGLAKEIAEIDRLNGKLRGFILLKAIEVDILPDGSLDLPDEVLAELDLTVCSVHYNMNLSRQQQTERIIRAMDNPYFNILAHPTGRLINKRSPYEVDVERLLEAARQRGCFMELDSQPDRLDLAENSLKLAKDMGVKIAIDTDAHSIDDLAFMRHGIDQARRGWLEAGDVLNTRTWKDLKKLLTRPG